MQARAIQKSDVVFIVSFSPYSREALEVMAIAQRAGAKTIALTDSSASPLALEASLSLLFSVDSPSFFPSVSAGVGLVEALLELLVAAGGSEVAGAIEKTEQSLFDSGAYLQKPMRKVQSRS